MTGKVILDDVGDREPDYWITDMAPNGSFVRIAEILNLDLRERASKERKCIIADNFWNIHSPRTSIE